MFKHLIVGIDFPFEEDTFIEEIATLQPLIGLEELTLAHVTLNPNEIPEIQAELDKHASVIKGRLGLKAADAQALSGLPTEELNRLTSRKDAQGIALLFHHHSKTYEFFLGSVALDMARSTRHPLFFLNQQPDPSSGALMLASDGSLAAKAAEKLFAQLKPLAKKAMIINVPSDKDEPEHQQAVQKLKATFSEDAAVEILSGEGDPAKAIVQASNSKKADLLILGKRGQNPLKQLMFGSTAEQICRQIHRPVLIVPPELGD
ncbi:Universal stress protein family protein [Marinospirillum celere]|uniref:Universal stress protein family protein n=1 Tax=Marinospirillum celere TaxID=1122252 RepID=A0A1I1JRH6_9GAMM|nr:universal stress protein [Marinospirillum celere]SFC51164.1 Universal stress protein family protein [Marinospirillum celere]